MRTDGAFTLSAQNKAQGDSPPVSSLSAPSAKDLLILANYGSDPTYTNYRGEIIVNCNENDTTLYFLMVNNREKLKLLCNSLEGEVTDSHDFKTGGKCYEYLTENKLAYKSLPLNEQLMMKLILISDFFTSGSGMSLVKTHWNNKTSRDKANIIVFGMKKEEKSSAKPKSKNMFKPIKCL